MLEHRDVAAPKLKRLLMYNGGSMAETVEIKKLYILADGILILMSVLSLPLVVWVAVLVYLDLT